MYWDGSSLEITFADFQRIGVGRGSIDIALFSVLTLTVDQRRSLEEKLLATYHAALIEGGVQNYSDEDLRRDYRRGVAFVGLRSLAAQLLFTDPASSRGDAQQRMITAFEDLNAADALA